MKDIVYSIEFYSFLVRILSIAVLILLFRSMYIAFKRKDYLYLPLIVNMVLAGLLVKLLQYAL